MCSARERATNQGTPQVYGLRLRPEKVMPRVALREAWHNKPPPSQLQVSARALPPKMRHIKKVSSLIIGNTASAPTRMIMSDSGALAASKMVRRSVTTQGQKL